MLDTFLKYITEEMLIKFFVLFSFVVVLQSCVCAVVVFLEGNSHFRIRIKRNIRP